MAAAPFVHAAQLQVDASGTPAFFELIMVVFVVVAIASVGTAVYKFAATRQIAIEKGASSSTATALALSGDIGTAAAYVGEGTITAPVTGARSSADRVREVRELERAGLITPGQAEARIAEIRRSI